MSAENPVVIPARLPCHADARGVVFEPLALEEIPRQKNLHVVLTAPGGIRGNHYHCRGTETAVLLGPAQVRVRAGGQVRDLFVPEGCAYKFVFPPGVAHGFRNTGTAVMILVAFNTVPHDPDHPDVIKESLFAP